MEFIEVLKVIFLGVIEGITEWLPVSSTGHIKLVEQFFPLSARGEFKSVFEAVIQFGAVLAVVILFFSKLFPFAFSEKQDADGNGEKMKIIFKKDCFLLWVKIFIACIPAGIVGILFELPEHPIVISCSLIFYGIVFILIERRNKNRTFKIFDTDSISYKQAFIIGLFQMLSLIPGTSRSGITIIGALLLGISRPAGSEFTFLMSVPVMAGASLIRTLQFVFEHGFFTGEELGYLLIGTLTAFAVSLFAIKFLMSFVQKHDFSVFGWYRIGLGVIVLIVLYLIPMFA